MEYHDLIDKAEAFALQSSKKSGVLPNLFVFRRSEPSGFEATIYNPVICLILQGSKTLQVGGDSLSISAGDALLVSHDLPVASQITQATREKPYLALILSLDLSVLRSLYEHVDLRSDQGTKHALMPMRATSIWVEPLARYLNLASDPLAANVLGPSLLREIHFRLLTSPAGGMLRNLLSMDSHASRIAKAIQEIRLHYRDQIAVSHLARISGMSVSSFHEHFKSVTGTSPLQYQKDLRMIEARRLLSENRLSVTAAGFEVGYESPTQFSREFSRKFGEPPSRVAAPAQ